MTSSAQRDRVANCIRESIKASNVKDKRAMALAEHLDVEKSTVYSWRSGARIPSSEEIVRMAGYLFPKDTTADRRKRTELIECVESRRPKVRVGSDLERYAMHGIRVTSTNFFGRRGFLDEFFERFCRLAGIRLITVRDADGADVKDVKQMILEDEVDVGLGLFATLDRSLHLKFFPTPIRVGLNGVVLQKSLLRTGHSINEIQSMLRSPDRLDGIGRVLVPVVYEHDVGGMYAARMLGHRISYADRIERFHCDEYGKALLQAEKAAHDARSSDIPVALVDEITALYVLRYLGRREHGARLLFPFTNDNAPSEQAVFMPRYLVSLSVKRTNRDLTEYLQDGLRLFLRTELQMVAEFYYRVCLELEELGKEQWIFNEAWKFGPSDAADQANRNDQLSNDGPRGWLSSAFGLSAGQLLGIHDMDLPWLPVLRRATELLQKDGWSL